MTDFDPPAFREWNPAAVRLLQGVVYHDDGPVWDVVLRSQSRLEDYFAAIGLRLIIDEPEGFAYLRQLTSEDDGELPEGYETLPKLFRRIRLSYDATLLCVLLREELRRFEEEEVDNERCVVATAELFEQWKSFFAFEHDEVRLKRTLETALKKLEELKFVRPFGTKSDEWEVRRILKARLTAADLEKLKTELVEARSRME